MEGFSAVATASVEAALRAQPARLAWMPRTHFSFSTVAALVSSAIDDSRLRAISGTRTLSSKLPCMPPIVIARSLPITCAATCSTTSGITGLTLPRTMDEPFCSSGTHSSPNPARELGVGVQPGPGRDPPERDLRDARQRLGDPRAAEADLGGVAGELLAES